uniref:(northern house mosquito) hypothetical protein n=2 Tax=Culex pipiens TaxID=7175 RepID=A0A8D8HQH7_CULPI
MENDRKKMFKKKILIYTIRNCRLTPRRDERVIFTLFSVYHTNRYISTCPKQKPNQTYHFDPTKEKKKVQDISNFANFVNTCLVAQLKNKKKCVFLLEVKIYIMKNVKYPAKEKQTKNTTHITQPLI